MSRILDPVSLPPGPRSLPVIGNLTHIPLRHPWKKLSQLKNDYGSLLYFHGLGNSILVLNDYETMLDLLVRKGNTYCSRPYFVVACELMDLINSTAFAPFGKRWRLHRKLARVALDAGSLQNYESGLINIATNMCESLSVTPEEFIDHIRLAAGRVIMTTMYGINVQSADDPYIVRAETAMSVISKAVIPGEFLVDLVPLLKYLPSYTPFTNFRKVGYYGREVIAELVEQPYRYVQKEMAAGTIVPSFTRYALTRAELKSDRDSDTNFEHAVKWAAASMYAAGQEVISSAILNLIMGLALNPDKLYKAQTEIDEALGSTPLAVEDQKSLPYINCIIKETLRWHPPLPMDIARASIENDTYKGYWIPKNTTIIPNIWSIAHAPDPDFPPDSFAPERFLKERENPPLDPFLYVFGFGRRICPGRILAEQFIFVMAVSIIRKFDIGLATSSDGKKIPINVQYSSGLVSLPERFECCIKPRRIMKV